MPKIIEAIYENGVFKPLQKVELRDGEKVRLRVDERRIRRREFLRSWNPLRLERKVTADEIKRLRYEDIL
ncbi:MAG: antitoxin family protein [Archaeoglobi archaeon]|nr:antitoxin family protein [Candidatus Mnemosynella bozhongmuii]